MNYIKKVTMEVLRDNVPYNIYYYSTLDKKVEVLEKDENVWFINVSQDVNLNIDNAEHMLKEGTLEEMLKEGKKLYKLILKEENK